MTTWIWYWNKIITLPSRWGQRFGKGYHRYSWVLWGRYYVFFMFVFICT